MMERFATRCPHCHTPFRVSQAQLDARAGQVRCGVCQNSFDGLAHRFELADSSASAASFSSSTAQPAPQPQPQPQPQVATEREEAIDLAAPGLHSTTRSSFDRSGSDFDASVDSFSAADGASMQAELDALSQAISDLRAKPWTEPPIQVQLDDAPDDTASMDDDVPAPPETAPLHADVASQPEDAFMQNARRRSRSRRAWTVLLWIGIPLLTLVLAAQLLYYFRNDIAARSPQAARQLRMLCAQLGCTIRLPMHLDQLSLEGTQLDASPLPNPTASNEPSAAPATEGEENAAVEPPKTHRLTLAALLRNRGSTAQAWPSIDLQLKGADGKVFVRKTFLPNQYLRADDIPAGMSARSEMEIRIPFELTGNAPAGFEATLFYH